MAFKYKKITFLKKNINPFYVIKLAGALSLVPSYFRVVSCFLKVKIIFNSVRLFKFLIYLMIYFIKERFKKNDNLIFCQFRSKFIICVIREICNKIKTKRMCKQKRCFAFYMIIFLSKTNWLQIRERIHLVILWLSRLRWRLLLIKWCKLLRSRIIPSHSSISNLLHRQPS